jgi:hypothetical protein
MSGTWSSRTMSMSWVTRGSPYGIHWPDTDEDLCTEGLLRGAPAPRGTGVVVPHAARRRTRGYIDNGLLAAARLPPLGGHTAPGTGSLGHRCRPPCYKPHSGPFLEESPDALFPLAIVAFIAANRRQPQVIHRLDRVAVTRPPGPLYRTLDSTATVPTPASSRAVPAPA